jgi:iron complex transport system substrate-binding protein
MKRFILAIFASLVCVGIMPSAIPVAHSLSSAMGGRGHTQPMPQRVISVVPSVTEMLFAIGAGPRVVGVGSFDRHPPEVVNLPRVGGLLDPDLEAILALHPDLVIVYATQSNLKSQLERAGVPIFSYAHGGLTDITDTIRTLGSRLGVEDRARTVARGLEAKLQSIRARVGSARRPRTMIVFGREPGSLRNIYASGGIGFMQDMLTVAGGENVFADIKRESVQATTELILARAPDVIVEMKLEHVPENQRARERDVWKRLPALPAVGADRILILVGDDFVVPGPRVADATEKLARALHPTLF